METWKTIKDYPDYEISDLGNFRKKDTGKLLNHWSNGKGYRYVCFGQRSERKNKYVHRLVAEAFIPIVEGKPDINHKNGVKSDNRRENLEWCNKFENMRHAYDNKLLYNPAAKLCEMEVNIIRKLWSVGVNRDQISQTFNISFAQISRIVNYKNWQ